MTEVIMPKMGDGMEEGTLLEWLKKDGDKVKSGEVIGSIQTDKATLDLEAPGSGTFSGILINAGDTVPVGKPIAAILKEGEALPKEWGSESEMAAKSESTSQKAEPAAAVAAAPSIAASGSRVKASPLAKKIASTEGVDLQLVAGSGPGGRIVERDVRAVAEKAPATAMSKPLISSGEDRVVPLNRLRQITAQRTQQSKQEAPHFYVTVEVDVEKISQLRELFAEEESGKVSVNDFVVKACALALREMPEVNASFNGDSVLIHGDVNVGVAAAVNQGLLVPVIMHADQLTLREIAARSKELVKKAHDGKLHPDEMSHSTFSISNMGMLDVDSFSAIINTPNAAIVAIGTASKKAVVNADDELEIRLRMNITGSFDHRVVDGAIGARFMNVVRGYLQNPTRLIA